MSQVSFSDLVDGVIHTAAHHNDRFNALKSRINAIQSDNLEDSSVTGPKIAMGSDAQGDILIRGVTSYQRLAAGTSGQFLQTLGAGANLVWSDLFTIASGQNTSDFGMTASSYTDVTSVTTGAFTAKAGIAIITVNAVYGLRTSFTLAVTDGSNNVIATTGANNVGIGGSPIKEGISFTFLTTLSAGSNTLKLRYKLDDGETTGTLYGTKSPTIIQVAYIG